MVCRVRQSNGARCRRTNAVASAPNQCGAAIETMSLVAFEIVDQDFIGQIVDY